VEIIAQKMAAELGFEPRQTESEFSAWFQGFPSFAANYFGGQGWIRTIVLEWEQIYSFLNRNGTFPCKN